MKIAELKKLVSQLSRIPLKIFGIVNNKNRQCPVDLTLDALQIKPGSQVNITFNRYEKGQLIIRDSQKLEDTKIEFNSKNTILDIKEKYSKIKRIHSSAFTLFLDDRQLDERSIVGDQDIGDGTILKIGQSSKMIPISDYIMGFPQLDVDVLNPHLWRNAQPGLNAECLCTNMDCSVYKKYVVFPVPIGYDNCFDFKNDQVKAKCPICFSTVQAEAFALIECDYQVFGIIENQDKLRIKHTQQLQSVKRKYVLLNLEPPSYSNWICLQVIIQSRNNQSFIPQCFICTQQLQTGHWDHGPNCKHTFHIKCLMECEKQFGQNGCIVCQI